MAAASRSAIGPTRSSVKYKISAHLPSFHLLNTIPTFSELILFNAKEAPLLERKTLSVYWPLYLDICAKITTIIKCKLILNMSTFDCFAHAPHKTLIVNER